MKTYRVLFAAAALFLVALACQAQTTSCTVNVAVAPLNRAESRADYVGDTVLVCTGGTPTPSGSPVPFENITVVLNTNVDSRLLAPNWSEVLLIVDEPGSAISPGTPQLVCGAAGTTEFAPGVCTMTGTGTGAGTYSGTGARPNVFQGKQSVNNRIDWTIPFDPPAAGGSRILRLTNIRADNFALGPAPATPNTIFASLSISGPMFIAIVNPVVQVAYSLNSLSSGVVSPPTLPRCTPTNAALFADPTASGTPNLAVRVKEGFAGAFRVRSAAAFVGPDVSPVPSAQNIPGDVTYNETDFYNPAFPLIAGRGDLSRAGLADQGTRLIVSFTGVPDGVELFIQTTANLVRASDTTVSGVVRLVSTAADGSGVFSPAPGNAFGIAPVPLSSSGAGQAVFEVMKSDPFAMEFADVPVYVAFNRAHHGTAMVAATYAPTTTTGGSSTTAPIPRFANTGAPTTAFVLPNPCR